MQEENASSLGKVLRCAGIGLVTDDSDGCGLLVVRRETDEE